MARPLRIEYPGAWYHVMNRGRRKEKIFLSRHDYEAFIKVLQEASDAWNLKIAGYCLMPNHYHLLVHTPDGNLSRCMRHVNGVYTQRFNRMHQVDGQLFRGRYKAVLVDEEGYLLHVLRYIHRNPVEAGLARTVKAYEWSSHHGYISRARKWQWLHKDLLLAMLTTVKSRQKSTYLDFVGSSSTEEVERFYSLKNLPSVLGSDAFKEAVKQKIVQLGFHQDIPELRNLTVVPSELVEIVCDYFQTDWDHLIQSRRGSENLPRDMAMYLIRMHCRETLSGIGKIFGIEKYSTVSSAIERVRAQLKGDSSVKKHLVKIEKQIAKGQRQT